ncbi:MAG: ABC transporter ATP-binding protein [Candidatus Heimdallarchaeota archaeon]|nr:ABC transporter ATP-binding protein [Candidatus Heimdallarchaeota archaeon]
MSSNIISTNELTKYYGKILGIENISLKIPSGGVGLLGVNGAGKTTLIRTLLGIIRPTSGNAEVLGHDIRSGIHEIRDSIGYMPEINSSFVPESNAMQFVSFCGRMNGLSSSESKQRASDSLYYVGLGEERYRKLNTFSLGMKQKVKLAIALVHDPEILICDEPTNGLDPKGRNQMLNLLRDLQINQGKNVILSSHLLRDVEQTTDYAIIISQGKVLASGKIRELTQGKHSTISVKLKLRSKEQELITTLSKGGIEAWVERAYVEVKQNVSQSVEREIFTAAVAIGAEIRYLGSRSSTLEDVFLNLFQNEEAIA